MNVASIEALVQTCAAVFDEMDLDTGVTQSIERQELRDQILDDLRSGAYPQDPGLAALQRTRALDEGRGFREQVPAAAEQVFALRCELYAPAQSVEEGHTELRFERAYLSREGRLSEVQPVGGTRKAAAVDDGCKRAELAKVHALL
jgi:hypothetical protein